MSNVHGTGVANPAGVMDSESATAGAAVADGASATAGGAP